MRKIGFDKIESIVGQAMFPPFEKRFLLAKIYMKMNEYSFARDIMQQLAGEKPEPYLWFYLGNCSYFLGNPEAAVEYYQKAILADCKMAEAYNNLACIYMGKDKRTASKLLQQALQLRPGYMDAAHNIGQLKSGMADFKLTARELRKSLTNYMNVKLS
ncbi:MAG: tetratricopeptide repeat protein [Gracilibacteraceae bacterium]|nr:tetratricopeptide repeat protein [Gracilibacteraceae bacterium]